MIYNCEQYSADWWRVKNGKVTASMMWAVEKWCTTQTSDKDPLRRKKEITVQQAKGPKVITVAESSERQSYRDRIVSQILCGYHGQDSDEWKGKDVEWGMEFEATAVAQYEVANACTTRRVGFVTSELIPRFGCSPDRLVGTDGLAQIKCPKTTTHLNYRLAGVVPEEYEPQLVAEMACTGRQWADFVSFDPRLTDPDLRLLVIRLPRNEKRIAEVEAAVMEFLAEVDQTIAKLTGKMPTLEELLRDSLTWAQEQRSKELVAEPF